MILASEILKAIHTRMGGATLVTGAWPYVAPDEATYPFATYSVVSEYQDRTFSTDMAVIRVQFSVFDDDPSPAGTVNALCEIERLFDRVALSLPSEDGLRCVCSLKDTNGIRYLDQDHYWQGTADYEMRVQKNAGADLESSSMSSASSASSESSSASSVSSVSSSSTTMSSASSQSSASSSSSSTSTQSLPTSMSTSSWTWPGP